ncbi:hypothetical protein FOYG_16578 [Fusarium oxysporum NRRL 32931]|uniref:Uncharacterized protein n=1 Tax=Fusarium oxysporum NRRL 32931 TaxID=660029 RepID=W9HEG2_FUSOX|nr:hypothetical protein FOYG_16578 [Fusarium oxysporum NRRL 32931]
MVAASCPSQSLPCGVNRRSVPGGTRVPRKLPPEDLLKQERVQPRPLPIQKLAVPSSGHGLDEATPVQFPEKYPPVAESSSVSFEWIPNRRAIKGREDEDGDSGVNGKG